MTVIAKPQPPKTVKEAERRREGAGRTNPLAIMPLLHMLSPLLAWHRTKGYCICT